MPKKPSRPGIYLIRLPEKEVMPNRAFYWTGDHWRTIDAGRYGDDRVNFNEGVEFIGPLTHNAEKFFLDRGIWSRETFGSVEERGPIGPVKHLKEEQKEVVEALEVGDIEKAKRELVDCLFLVFDAMDRAGMSWCQIWDYANAKLAENRNRVWGKPSKDEPVKHVA